MAIRPTFTEQARRTQLIAVTIAQLAALGYARTSLARIAEAAGITKAAVLYYFTTKDAVVTAAYDAVLNELVAAVGAAVDAADPADRPTAYTRAMITHFADRPEHAHVIIEALTERGRQGPSEERWRPVADLLQEARAVRRRDPLPDPRTAALALGGAIDAIVAERLVDADYDTVTAAATLSRWVARLLDD